MTVNNDSFTRLGAMFGAIAMTVGLLVASFSTPQANLISTVLA